MRALARLHRPRRGRASRFVATSHGKASSKSSITVSSPAADWIVEVVDEDARFVWSFRERCLRHHDADDRNRIFDAVVVGVEGRRHLRVAREVQDAELVVAKNAVGVDACAARASCSAVRRSGSPRSRRYRLARQRDAVALQRRSCRSAQHRVAGGCAAKSSRHHSTSAAPFGSRPSDFNAGLRSRQRSERHSCREAVTA